MHNAIRCPKDKFYTDIWPTEIDYSVWIYNIIPGMKSGLSAIEVW